ncbi:catalase [Aspergillus carlsbadensis]|nr:catalase [Aspergillus carlsbadensis]
MSNGCPLDDPLYTEAASRLDGKNRKVSQAIQDSNTIDISHNTRERIPERYVHAKGVGAFGVFEVTSNTTFDVTNYTDAKFLNKVGKKTRLLARFSTVAGERGFPDTVRDTKGAAFKLYTEDGNLDWLFLNPEIFPIRDPSKFPSLVHATKRDPASGLQDANMVKGYNFLTWLFSDEGTPKCYSKMQAHSVHCYSFTKKDTSTTPATWKRTLVRIKAVPDPPIDWENDYFNLKMATTIVGKDPDWLRRGLYNEIINKNYPTWKVMAQIVQNPAASDVNVFDATKVLSELNFPWQEFGKITLNECPRNFFSQVEQAAFNPANVVPGWDVSPDPVLQIRLFTYGDTQRYRLGANNDQLLPNRACSYVYTPTRRDGAHSSANYGNTRNYIRENDNNNPPSDYKISSLDWVPEKIERFKSSVDDSDYQQCADHYRWLHENDLARNFIRNVAASLSTAHEPTRHAAYGK